MNTSTIINNQMTLNEKLAAIDAAMVLAQLQSNSEASACGGVLTTNDPVDLMTCGGCQ